MTHVADMSVVPSSLLAAATSAWWRPWLVARTAVVASQATSGVSECWRGGQGQRGREQQRSGLALHAITPLRLR